MLFSKREYALTTEVTDKQIILQLQNFLTANEAILYTFDADGVIAFFTSKKIIFVCTAKIGFFETELLPYHSIVRCSVLGVPDKKHGKLEITLPDKITVSFYLSTYNGAVELCHAISEYI